MKTIRKLCIEVLKKYNPNIDIKVFNLLEEGQIKHYYSIDEGEHKSIPNIELLKTINHDDIFSKLDKHKLKIAYEFLEEDFFKNEKPKTEYFVTNDVLNKKIIHMVNDNIPLDRISYTININKQYIDRRFTYFDILILRTIYNIYRNGLRQFKTNDVYYELFQCHGENVSISKDVKMQINNSIEYLRMIELNINAYQTFITKDIILPINILSIDLKENGRFLLLREPILYTYVMLNGEYFIDNNELYKFSKCYENKRNIKNLILYTKILDFYFSLKMSKNRSMQLNFTTIFNECGFTFKSRSNKKKTIDRIKDYLKYLSQNDPNLNYNIIMENGKYKKIKLFDYSYKKKKKNDNNIYSLKKYKDDMKAALSKNDKEPTSSENEQINSYFELSISEENLTF